MEAVSSPTITDEDLTCPITWDIFRDPVIAKDGHVYEREAITMWILTNGTSPLTREPLNIEELQPDDHLRQLAAQRRSSPICDNLNQITLSLVQSTPLITTRRYPEQFYPVIRNQHSNKLIWKQRAYSIFAGFVIICIVALLTAVIGRAVISKINNSPKYVVVPYRTLAPYNLHISHLLPMYTSSKIWSSFLTQRNQRIYSSNGSDQIYYYQEIEVRRFSMNSQCTFKSNSTIHLFGHLYNNSFTGNMTENLLESGINLDDKGQFEITYYLESRQKYILVVSAQNPNTTGFYDIFITSTSSLQVMDVELNVRYK